MHGCMILGILDEQRTAQHVSFILTVFPWSPLSPFGPSSPLSPLNKNKIFTLKILFSYYATCTLKQNGAKMLENSFTCSYSFSSKHGGAKQPPKCCINVWVVVLFYNNYAGF